MDWILSISNTILIFIAAIFILVTIHELGHFLAAKFFGMRVDKFSIGFPPKIFGFKKGDTDYVIGATPLGGYVSIAGMLDESMDTEFVDQEVQPDEFRAKPVWQRMIVITAGVIFNVILAVFIYAGVAMYYGDTVIPIDTLDGAYVSESSVAYDIGLRTGDRLIGVNGKEVDHFRQLLNPSELTDRNLTFLVERQGERMEVSAPRNFLDLVSKEGFISQEHYLPSTLSSVQEGSPADEAGLKGGDRIVSVDGEPIEYWVQLVEKIQATESELNLTVERDGNQFEITVAPDPSTGQIGVGSPNFIDYFEVEQVRYNVAEAMGEGVNRSTDALFGITQGIGKMFSGDISVRDNLGGPVAIANVTREATDRGGWLGFWNITAFLSITLAIMNMLPIPALDGGHFMFLLYEGITRREPSPKVRMGLQQLGFILLIGIFILVTFNDILRTFGG